MTQELSYLQLKTANEARQSDEQKTEFRKKEILVLILGYLSDEGYLDTLNALETESGLNLEKYSVCDNIDLPTVLQEYQSYYNVKFNRYPKIIKKLATNPDKAKLNRPVKGSLKNRVNSCSLPNINTSKHETETSPTRPLSDGKRKVSLKTKVVKAKSLTTINQDDLSLAGNALSANQSTSKETIQTVQNIHGKNIIVDVKAMLSNAIKGNNLTSSNDSSEKLLKPLAGFAGLTGEWRELAAVVSRDIYLDNPDVYWQDIVGLENAKRLVKEAVVYPIKYPQLFTGILSPWKGLLLYGPPGTGKTLLAKAVATECNTTFFNISASTIVSKWRGDSEKLVRVLFELARFHAPSTIFLDELESLMSQRGTGSSGDHEGSRRMKTELLIQMDGLAKSNDLVFLLGASNLPWELDHAMLRRLEKRILVNLPSEEARKQMVRNHLPPTINSSTNGLDIKTEIDYDLFAKKLEGYSGSDIKLLCKEAAMRPLRKVFDVLENVGDERTSTLPEIQLSPVTNDDLLAALSTTKPSARQLQDKYAEWQKEYESV